MMDKTARDRGNSKKKTSAVPPKHTTKKLLLRILAAILLLIFLLHGIAALTENKNIEYTPVSFSSPKLPAALDGYRIAFVVDAHAMTSADLEVMAGRLNEENLDLLALGGDFASSEGAPERTMKVLSKIKTRDGLYGVEGNHDDYAALFAAMEKYGAHPLSNSGLPVRDGLFIAGVEDLWNRTPDILSATKDAEKDDFVLLLAHNPDLTMEQDTTSADLILSGHTHGGQVTFFGLWAPGLTLTHAVTRYGQRFLSGWAQAHDGTPVYVSRGAGFMRSTPRVFARPQVVLLTLVSG